jgi:hypothetical protein
LFVVLCCQLLPILVGSIVQQFLRMKRSNSRQDG